MRDGRVSIALGEVFVPTSDRLGSQATEPRVFSISKHDGVVPADEYHGRRIASEKLDTYKCLPDEGWAYSTIHIDEGSISRNTNGFDGVVSPMYTTMKWDSESNDPAFFEMLLRSSEMLTRYADSAQGSINRRRSLPWSTFSTMKVDVPLLAEQRRIVDLIGSLDEAIEAADVLALSLSRQRLDMFAGTIPNDSPTAPLGELLDEVIDHRGKTPAKLGGEFTERGVPVISAIHLKRGGIAWDERYRFVSQEMYERWMAVPLRRGDVLLTSEAPLGSVAQVPTDDPLVLSQRLFALRGKTDVLDSSFLRYFLQSARGQDQLIRRSSGTTVTGIRQSELLQIEIPLPPVVEQCAAVRVLGAIDEAAEAASSQAASLRHLRTNLLTSLLSGAHEIPESYNYLLTEAV